MTSRDVIIDLIPIFLPKNIDPTKFCTKFKSSDLKDKGVTRWRWNPPAGGGHNENPTGFCLAVLKRLLVG